MSANTYFYACGAIMDKVSVNSVTSENGDHVAENAIDFNPITYWEPTSTATNALYLDLGAAKTVDNLVLGLYNYADVADAEAVELSHSDDAAAWTVIQSWSATAGGDVSERVKIYGDVSTAGSHRYWRVTIGGTITTALKITHAMLCNRVAVSFGSTAPEVQTNPLYNNSEYMSGGGVRFVFGKAHSSVRRWQKNWAYCTSSVLTNIQSIVDYSFGRRFPLVVSDDINNSTRAGSMDATSDRFLCRFNKDDVEVTNPTADFWNAGLDWTEEYYIRDGEAY